MFQNLYPFQLSLEGLLLFVRVTPRASKNRLGSIEISPQGTPFLKIYVTSPPVEGEANEAAITLIAQKSGIPKTKIKILKGGSSRQKTFFIQGDPTSLQKMFTLFLQESI